MIQFHFKTILPLDYNILKIHLYIFTYFTLYIYINFNVVRKK